jgi:hypothetical protein
MLGMGSNSRVGLEVKYGSQMAVLPEKAATRILT